MLLKNWLYKTKFCLISKTATFLSCCFVLFPFSIFSQINFVQNPSFEDTTHCPTFVAQINLANNWGTLLAGGGGSPELFSRCSISPVVDVPSNFIGFQFPKNGNNYSGIVCFDNRPLPIREYIQNKLAVKLLQGKQYCVSFNVSLSDSSKYGIDVIGAYLDNGSVQTTNSGVVNNITPQIISPSSIFQADQFNWIKIQGTFVANGDEEYLTIGNFKDEALTNTVIVSNTSNNLAYYYIDDVSVIDADTKAYAGNDKLICTGDSVFIGRTPEIGLECEWFVNGSSIAVGAGIWVKPNSTQQYIVKEDVCGIISFDTVQVVLRDDNICNSEIVIPNTFTPNNDDVNDVWQFALPSNVTLSVVEVYNRWGNLIHQTTNNSSPTTALWDGRTTSGEPCSEGVYFYVLKYTDAKGEVQSLKGYISLFR